MALVPIGFPRLHPSFRCSVLTVKAMSRITCHVRLRDHGQHHRAYGVLITQIDGPDPMDCRRVPSLAHTMVVAAIVVSSLFSSVVTWFYSFVSHVYFLEYAAANIDLVDINFLPNGVDDSCGYSKPMRLVELCADLVFHKILEA